jgi:hypothetical protein
METDRVGGSSCPPNGSSVLDPRVGGVRTGQGAGCADHRDSLHLSVGHAVCPRAAVDISGGIFLNGADHHTEQTMSGLLEQEIWGFISRSQPARQPRVLGHVRPMRGLLARSLSDFRHYQIGAMHLTQPCPTCGGSTAKQQEPGLDALERILQDDLTHRAGWKKWQQPSLGEVAQSRHANRIGSSGFSVGAASSLYRARKLVPLETTARC